MLINIIPFIAVLDVSNESIQTMPFGRNPHFVGRDDVFRKLTDCLTRRADYQPRVALCGLGGIGYVSILR
jgi:hypothetical protein